LRNRLVAFGAQLPQHFRAVQVWHIEIEQQKTVGFPPNLREDIAPTFRFATRISARFQNAPEQTAASRVVIGDQDWFFLGVYCSQCMLVRESLSNLTIVTLLRLNYKGLLASNELMKSLSWLALPALLIFASCTDEPPVRHRTARFPAANVPPVEQPYNPDQPPPPPPLEAENPAPETAESAAPTRPTKGDYPYGIAIPNEPGFVMSPYAPGKKVDVRGMPPGMEVKDPYTDFKKIFLVP